jgi:DNA-binding transcriptional regulator LsrR (DeoR family)
VTTEPDDVAQARLERMRDLEKNGWNRKQIGQEYGISRQRVAQLLGRLPDRGRRGEVHIYIVPEAYEKIVEMAEGYGLRHRAGRTAGQGSVGLLLEQVAQGNLKIEKVGDDSSGHVREDRSRRRRKAEAQVPQAAVA